MFGFINRRERLESLKVQSSRLKVEELRRFCGVDYN